MAKMADGRFDRRAVLENAQRLAQQNKVSQAIEAYEQLVRHDPSDWSSANTLGDLLVRARLVDQAIGEYVRIAHYLISTGFLARAGAIYRKVLRLDPKHADALRQMESLNIQRFAKPGDTPRRALEPLDRLGPVPAPAVNPALAEPMRSALEPTSQTESVNATVVAPAPTPATPSGAMAPESDSGRDCTWSWDQPDPSPA